MVDLNERVDLRKSFSGFLYDTSSSFSPTKIRASTGKMPDPQHGNLSCVNA